MHRMILGAEQGMVGDLRDKDGLNNQVENLRVCDRSQNVMGAARYRLGASRLSLSWGRGVGLKKTSRLS